MKKSKQIVLAVSGAFLLISLFYSTQKADLSIHNEQKSDGDIKLSGAGKSLDMWSFERAYPYENVPMAKLISAFEDKKQREQNRSNSVPGEWESLGPENIGGRTLDLAFHPTDPTIIFAGSASGGLWKTTTGGVGRFAWEYVPTGFPVLGVASVAIDPNNPDIILLGTGENYGFSIAEPGTINRVTRGSYGIGILKSMDGGTSWSSVLTFSPNQIKGVHDIEINPQNSLEMFAAATDGLFRSLDGGDTWSLVFSNVNCRDVEIDPTNGDIVYVTQGNLNTGGNPNANGIFKSTDKGNTFNELLDPGLITVWSGMAKLTIDPTNSNTLYASVQEGFTTGTTTGGIFKSTDAGSTWTRINSQNIAQFQGWYSHDVAVNPNNPSEIMAVGVQTWKSTDGGANFVQKSANTWTVGQVSVEIPEGADNYVHADVHEVYYHPLVANKIYLATDGGVFSSSDGGENYVTHNGGLQTMQLYANMGSSTTNRNFLIAGAQDNQSWIYRGDPSWFRVLAGDGMSASVRPDDDQIVFGSSQGLAIRKSINGGNSFFNSQPIIGSEGRAFSAPYEIAPSDNDIMYAGATFLYKNIVGGGSVWNATSAQSPDGSNVIVKIAVSPTDPDLIYIATAPDPFFGTGTPKVFRSVNGGQSFTNVSGSLPNRVCKDIEFDPTDTDVVYTTFSGFGSNHVFKTVNSGNNWNAIDNGLPDLPTNTIAIDPLNPDDVYVGNDLGVYYSEDGGASWEVFSDALPEATMIYDLNVSPSNRKLRIATHGHGIWQRSFVNDPLAISDLNLSSSGFKLYPNPASQRVTIDLTLLADVEQSTIDVYSLLGARIARLHEGPLTIGNHQLIWDQLGGNSAGVYFVVIKTGRNSVSKRLIIQ